jgi:sodium transport system permease protein
MNRAIKSIVNRELKRIFTDKRMIFTLFVLPALSIALIYIVMGYVSMNFINDVNEHESSYVINNAPERFKQFVDKEAMERISISYVNQEGVEAYADAIRNGDIDMYVAFDLDFETQIENMEEVTIQTYYNYGEDYSEEANSRMINDILEPFRNEILKDRFENENVVKVFQINDMSHEASVINEDKASGKILSSILPMLISIFLFAGAMSVVVESIAGEKERGTLATLLMTPVERTYIAIGKMVGHMIIATLSALSSIVGIGMTFLVLIWMIPNEGDLGIALKYGFFDWVSLVFLMLMLVAIYVGIVSLLSALAKSVKEASTYITPVYMGIMVLSFMNMYSYNEAPFWQYAIPIYGQIIGLKAIFMYQMTLPIFVICLLNAVVIWTILVWVIRSLFNSEKMLFTE